jgi:hypothetical protein
VLSDLLGLLLLLGDVAQAVLQAGDLAEPLHSVGFLESFTGVDLDLDESWQLLGVEAKHGAADAGVLVVAGRSVGTVAGAQGHLAEAEMIAELLPFDICWFAIFLARAAGPALVHKIPVVADDLLGIDRDISLSGIEVEVSKELGGDVDRDAAVDGLRGEDSTEVVWSEPQWGAVDVDDGCSEGQVGQ